MHNRDYTHIAFIDDGINCNVINCNLIYDLEIDKSSGLFTKRKTPLYDYITHGTQCAAIVKHNSQNVKFSSLKILDHNNLRCNIHNLVKAIRACIEIGVDIINISLGSTNFGDDYFLKDVINDASKNAIIVAALANSGKKTYPASYRNVICVKKYSFTSDKYCIDGSDFIHTGKHTFCITDKSHFTTQDANSFSAPFVTSCVSNIILNSKQKCYNTHEIVKYINCIHSNNLYIINDWVSNAIVFTDHDIACNTLPFNVISIESLNLIIQDSLNIMVNKKEIDTVIVIIEKRYSSYEISLIADFISTSTKKTLIIDYNCYFLSLNTKLHDICWISSTYLHAFPQTLKDEVFIPIILFITNGSFTSLNICKSTSDIYKMQGYSSIVVSTNPLSSITECILVPDFCLSQNDFIATVCDKFNCDIIFFETTDEKIVNNEIVINDIAPDIIVNCCSKSFCNEKQYIQIFSKGDDLYETKYLQQILRATNQKILSKQLFTIITSIISE